MCTRHDTTSFSVQPASSQERGDVLDRLGGLRGDVRSELAGLRIEAALPGEIDPAVDDETGREGAGRLRPDHFARRHSEILFMDERTKHIGARVFAALRPSPRVPTMPWSAQGSNWWASPDDAARALPGLALFGIGEGALVAAGLGNAPWTVLAQGVARRTPLDIGGATIVVSLVVLLGWIPLRQRPGLGTVGNVVVIGVVLDVASRVLPEPSALRWQLLQVAAGSSRSRVASALYLTANLGPGPRDGWMTGIQRRTGIGIATVRTTIEVCVLVARHRPRRSRRHRDRRVRDPRRLCAGRDLPPARLGDRATRGSATWRSKSTDPPFGGRPSRPGPRDHVRWLRQV